MRTAGSTASPATCWPCPAAGAPRSTSPDVTTLGKTDIQGPDAGALPDRLYVNTFSTLKVGRARYGLMLLRLHGPAVRDVLSSVVPIDLHPRSFRAGHTAITLAGHIGVQLRQVDDAPIFELMIFRSYAGSLFDLLLEAGLRFGVEVLPVDVHPSG